MATFIIRDDSGFATQLTTFATNIDQYATVLNLTTDEVNSIKADSKYFAYIVKCHETISDYAKAVTSHKDNAHHGSKNKPISNFPQLPILPVSPPAVPPGIKQRFSKLAARIKKSANYSKEIGIALGIIAVQHHFDPHQGEPKLKIITKDAQPPVIKFKKGNYQAIELWKDTGNGFVKVDVVMYSNHVDLTTPMPDSGKSAIWKYRAIYIYKGKIVGKWSTEYTVTVLG